jgi:hypothetical protein
MGHTTEHDEGPMLASLGPRPSCSIAGTVEVPKAARELMKVSGSLEAGAGSLEGLREFAT